MKLHSKWRYLSHDKYGQYALWTEPPEWDSMRGHWFPAQKGCAGRTIASDTFEGLPQTGRKYKLLWKIQRDNDGNIFFEEVR